VLAEEVEAFPEPPVQIAVEVLEVGVDLNFLI
jgi:hypothetical protein